mgnify:CR=1 FL=1
MNNHSSARYIVTGHRRGLGAALTHALLAQGHAVLGMSRGLLYSQANMRPSTLHEVAIDLAQSAQVCEWIERDALTHFLSDGRPAVLIEAADLPGEPRILIGVGPFKHLRMAEHMRDKVWGVTVPDELITRMQQADDEAETGMDICVEVIQALRDVPGVAGVHVMAIAWEDAVPEILTRAGLATAAR